MTGNIGVYMSATLNGAFNSIIEAQALHSTMQLQFVSIEYRDELYITTVRFDTEKNK